MKFTKMHGNGNDFIVIEDFERRYLKNQENIAMELCHRNFGIGADGVLFVRNTDEADIEMVIINSDGSYAAMCGNGLRCFVKYVYEKDIVKADLINVKTGDGIKSVEIKGENGITQHIKVNMGKPSFDYKDIPLSENKTLIDYPIIIKNRNYNITTLRMGVPHTVIFGELKDFNIEDGKDIETNEIFKEGTNVNFCEIVNRNHIKVMTWERGAGPTLACGTGNCASAFAAKTLNLVDNKILVEVQGGKLNILIENNHVFMIGNAEFICEGNILMDL